MWLTRVSIRNPVFAAMMMLALMVLGLFSFRAISVEEFPNVEMPFVIVTTNYPGASPEVVESDVTRKIEDSVNTISGVKRVFSTSFEGRSFVAIEFFLDVPIPVAVQDVRDKVAVVKTQFRSEIKEPLVERYNPGAVPVVSLAFTSDTVSPREVTTFVDQKVVKQLQTVPGVGKVDVIGGVKREVRINLDPRRMQALNVGIDQVDNALKQDTMEYPAGSVVTGNLEKIVQIKGRMATPSDYRHLVVANHNGTPIYLEQVADVVDGEQNLDSLALVNGQRAVSVDVVKMSGANTITVVDRVKAVENELKAMLPVGVHMVEVADTSRSIRASLADVEKTLVEGAVLAVAIVFLFLGSWRSTVITSLTLPISLFGTLFALYVCGFTLNLMTLMAVSLCIGLLVDDAIVVRENIVRHGAMGKSAYRAALDGTEEIGLAVLATTLSIVAVFLPVAFMGGIIGKFFYQFGVTVTSAVLLSMFVSFTLDPMLSSVWHDPHVHGARGRGGMARLLTGFEKLLDRLGEQYTRIIAWALRHRLATMGIALASFWLATLLAGAIGKEFVPEPDLSEIGVKFSTPVGSSLSYTEQKVAQVTTLLRQYPEVITTYSTINGAFDVGKDKADIRVKLKPKQLRHLSQKDLVKVIRERLKSVAGIDVTSVAAAKEAVSGGLKPIMISIQGMDLSQLQKISADFISRIEHIPGVVDVESSMKETKPTLAIVVDRNKAADLGLTPGQVGAALRPLLEGDAMASWQGPDGENYDVRVELPESGRHSVEDIRQLRIASGRPDAQGVMPMVALSQIADVQEVQGAAQINRRSLFREVMISANVSDRPAGDIGADIQRVEDRMKLPPGYRFQVEGQNKDMAESVGYAAIALVLAVVFIYMVLGSQFNSFLHPITIMTSLPLSLVGVFAALFLFHSTLNIFSIIGVVMLMGLVTKNAILLIDFIRKGLEDGMERTHAIMMAGRTRLRPILMTTAAMIMGMLPLALGLGEGAEQRAPMAHALIGGVLTSTLLTLVVVPVVFTYLDDLTHWLKRLLRIQTTPPATLDDGLTKYLVSEEAREPEVSEME